MIDWFEISVRKHAVYTKLVADAMSKNRVHMAKKFERRADFWRRVMEEVV